MKSFTKTLIVLTALSFSLSKSESNIERSPEFCRTEAEAKDPNNPCKCYCSVKCGPRTKRPGKDPIYFDKQLGVPWCQTRDIRLYAPNKCVLKQPKLEQKD